MEISIITEEELDDRCKKVLGYLIPEYSEAMTAKQYNNAMAALRTIALGLPKGATYNEKK